MGILRKPDTETEDVSGDENEKRPVTVKPVESDE